MKTPVEDFLNSIYAVTIPMLLLIISFSIKLSALFYTTFKIPVPELKLAASILLGITVSLTLLAVSVNAKLFETNAFPIVFAVCSGVMLLFVFEVINEDFLPWSEYVKRIFLSVLLATVEYVFSKMFVKKYQETEKAKERKLEKENLELEIAEHKEELSELKRKVNEIKQAKSELEEEIAKENQVCCDECSRVFKNQNAFNAHKCKPKLTEIKVEFEEVIPD
ncbi:hypothetical protein AWE51_00110 [Aquimarina aggregata]|uniref:Uncharacterized protein n=1 Tax=Aquimarina aggregata TaxID=1642818 RepID=A0A162CTD7_9FLAO|nr:hypothetical protein [Aquimarina aggregata]KZS41884.1 hypothetical protein AWE51_00110 [Aquimarina aggregata]